MTKIKTRRWDPARHIADGADVLAYLQVIADGKYDPDVAPFFLDCIARSAGVADIARVAFHETDTGRRSVTVATADGKEVTIELAAEVSSDRVRNALLQRHQSAALSA